MATTTKSLRVDVACRTRQTVVSKQHDVQSRFLHITIADAGEQITVAQDAVVTVNARRPDGAAKAFLGQVNEDGTVTVPLTSWMLELAGDVQCDIAIVDTDGRRLSSMPFGIDVEQSICTDDITQDDTGSVGAAGPVGSGGSYTLPVATETELGGVRPVSADDTMTQPVGVDSTGGLWTAKSTVSLIDDLTQAQANLTPDEILQAAAAGKVLLALGGVCSLVNYHESGGSVGNATLYRHGGSINTAYYITIQADKSYSILPFQCATTEDRLPNPYALTFTGAVSAAYDGTAPVNVEIPLGTSGSGVTLFATDIEITEPVAQYKLEGLDPCEYSFFQIQVDRPSGWSGTIYCRYQTMRNGNPFETSQITIASHSADGAFVQTRVIDKQPYAVRMNYSNATNLAASSANGTWYVGNGAPGLLFEKSDGTDFVSGTIISIRGYKFENF